MRTTRPSVRRSTGEDAVADVIVICGLTVTETGDESTGPPPRLSFIVALNVSEDDVGVTLQVAVVDVVPVAVHEDRPSELESENV